MMDLPSYLQPQDDGWCLDDAVAIWLLVHYGIHRADPDTPELRRLRFQARREVATLASEVPKHRQTPPVYVRRVHREWGNASDQWPRQTRDSPPPRTWVTTAALAALCRQHGHTPPWEPAPAVEKPGAPRTPGGPAAPPGEPASGGKRDLPRAAASPTGAAGRLRLYDDLVREVEQEHTQRTLAAHGQRVTKAECIRAVVSRHLPMPDPTDYPARDKVKAKREKLIEALTHRMKPSRAP